MKILVVLTFCILIRIVSSDDVNWKASREKEFQNVANKLWGELKSAGSDKLKTFLGSNPTASTLGTECWDSKSFRFLNNHAIDIFLFTNDGCSEFCKSFNSSNSVKVFGAEDNTEALNHQLFWRGTIRMKDPVNSSKFRHIEHAELSYAFDKLDLLVDQIKNDSQFTIHNSQVTMIENLMIFSGLTQCGAFFLFSKGHSASVLTLN